MPRFPSARAYSAIAGRFGAVLLLALAACESDSTGSGDPIPPGEFSAIRLDDDAPPLCAMSVSFVAQRGASSEGELDFCDPVTGDPIDDFLEFDVGSNSLLRRPDGTLFAPGDTITITITVVDPQRLIFEFQPSGLVFDPSDPAELEISYRNCDRDFDEDGDEDSDDLEIEQLLTIFRQENPGDPWVPIGSAVIDDIDEVEAELVGFTRYAIAY